LSEDNRQYNFTIPTQEQAHEQEVTCFTFAKIGKNTTLLFSACCGGAIRFYPNALKSNGSFNLESTLAFNNFYGCGVFSLTSTVLKSPENITFNILCTGDRDGKVRLWSVGDDVSSAKNFRHLGQYNSSTQIGAGLHLVTKAKFINDSMLVTGTNQGSIRFWCLECKSNPARSIGKGPLPKLDLRYDLMGQHSGSVEVCTNVGDILLTSGGDDGKIIGWDINTGMKIGPAFRCHPGKRLTRLDDGEEVVVNSSVIDFVLNAVDGKLISLCRDGVLSEWRFGSSWKTAG
jgi:WD40 repeat protein